MIERLRVRCAGQIARGEIIPYQARYDTFLKLELQPNSKQCSLRPESCRFILIFDRRRRPSSDVLALRTPVAHVLVPSEYSLLKC